MARFSTGHFALTLSPTGILAGAKSVGEIYNGAVIDVYSGVMPADPDAALSGQTKIGSITEFVSGTSTGGITFGEPIITGTGSGKQAALSKPALTLWAVIAGTLSSSTTANWARLRLASDSAGSSSSVLPRIDMSVSDATGSGDLKLSVVNFTTGVEAQVAGFAYTQLGS